MIKVKVEQGWLEGQELNLSTGDGKYYSFKGIPYAAPPIGTLRFKAPEPPLAWNGIKKAFEHGHVSPQLDFFTNTIIPGNEDCLFLNVYTKYLSPQEPLPVMVFIHGGGFKSDSGNEDNYGPDFLVNHGIILVTINYRLEALGFLCLDTKEVPGNAGMKDQVAALKWVRKNISHFGGDPDNVTVFGESAGGASTSLHILSPMSKNLFHRAISMSGVQFCDWSLSFEPVRRAFKLGEQLGFQTRDPNKLLEFLQNVPVEKLADVYPYILPSEELTNGLSLFNFVPVVEKDFGQEHFLAEDPRESLKKEALNEVDILIGYTSQETIMCLGSKDQWLPVHKKYPQALVPRGLEMKCSPPKLLDIADVIYKQYFGDKFIEEDTLKEYIKFSSDSYFVYHINTFAESLPKIRGKRKFLYKFSCYSDRNVCGKLGVKYGIEGACHFDDMLYLFDPKRLNLKVDNNSKIYDMIYLTCKLFTNFAKFGHPTPDGSLGVMWPEFDTISKMYGDIGETLTVGAHPDKPAMDFWRKIYAMVE